MSATPIYSKLNLAIYTGSAFVNIPNISAITPPSAKADEIEYTNMDSLAKEFMASRLKDSGTANFTMQRVDGNATQAYIESKSFAGGAEDRFQLTFINGVKWEFSGSLTSYEVKADGPNGILTADVGLRVSGLVNRAAT